MRIVQTSLGPVPLWGDFDRFRADRPLVFVVRGAFAAPDEWTIIAKWLPEADVVFAHLPGINTPLFAENSIAAFARGFDEILAGLSRSKIYLLGLSTGALVALAMRSADALIAVEPPLTPSAMWPLIPVFRSISAEHPLAGQWVEDVFGITADQSGNLDFGYLLADCLPGFVLIGGEPLAPERAIEAIPSLVTAADRAKIAATPCLRVMVVPGAGHNVLAHARGKQLVALAYRQVSS